MSENSALNASRLGFFALLLLALAVPAAAQIPRPTPIPPSLVKPKPRVEPPCPLLLAQSPAWGTIKLGMTETDFQKLFPRMPFMVNKLDLPEDSAFDPIDNMMFTFYKERLEEVTIQFSPGMRWANVHDFTDYLSDTYKLPKLWTFSLVTGILECKGFTARAVSSRNEIKLRDTAAAKLMQAENAPPPAKDTPAQKPRPYR